MNAKFTHYDLKIVEPDFASPLTGVIIELEKLRVRKLGGSVHPFIFFELKSIFQRLESLASARIEGNNTTLSELIEKHIEGEEKNRSEKDSEIKNIEKAMDFIETKIAAGSDITKELLLELHKIVTNELSVEGSNTPGRLRSKNVTIQSSRHEPPMFIKVDDYMNELINFINQKIDKKYDLLITAIAHHRFAWIHPFDNGNGRVARLLTYAMLIKQGFNVKQGRILNPTAIFCIDRNKYYEMLAKADTGDKTGTLEWCYYVLNGLYVEITKIDKLLDKDYLIKKILLPALNISLEKQYITDLEHNILKLSLTNENMEIKASDLDKIETKSIATRSRIIGKLKQKNMLLPITQNGKIYTIGFFNNYLLRSVIEALKQENFAGYLD